MYNFIVSAKSSLSLWSPYSVIPFFPLRIFGTVEFLEIGTSISSSSNCLNVSKVFLSLALAFSHLLDSLTNVFL
jgi:hypothetical protein